MAVTALLAVPLPGVVAAGPASAAETCVPGVTAVKVCAEAGVDESGNVVVGADVTQPGSDEIAGERVEAGQSSSGDFFVHTLTEIPVYPGFVAPGAVAGRNAEGDPWASVEVNVGGFLLISAGTTANNDPLGEGNVCVTSYDPRVQSFCVSLCPPLTTICDPPPVPERRGKAVMADEKAIRP